MFAQKDIIQNLAILSERESFKSVLDRGVRIVNYLSQFGTAERESFESVRDAERESFESVRDAERESFESVRDRGARII